jgi:GH25 family lysozyme M1 (1,4-beta-N-acetylmuramidase)
MPILSKILGVLNGTNTIPQNWTLGIDCSHWQGKIDWAKMYSKGVKWAITKATDIGWDNKGFVDDESVVNYYNMTEQGILSGAYHWLEPKADPTYQANYYLNNFYEKYRLDFPPILDFEDTAVISYSDMLWRAKTWLAVVEQETGRRPIVYTSRGYMSRFNQSKIGFLSEYPLWTAQYIQRTYPTIYFPWNSWVMWQYSAKGHYPYFIYNDPLSGRGKEWGASSYGLDMNWFNGTYDDLLKFLHKDSSPVQPPIEPSPVQPPVEPPSEFEEFNAKCIASALTIREGPSIHYAKTGKYLRFGNIKRVIGEQNGWYKFAEEELFKAECRAYYLNIRNGPGNEHSIVSSSPQYLKRKDVVPVYIVENNWYKIDKAEDRWVSGYWMKRV